MTEVHRYKAVRLISIGGAHIGYDPHGPDVVMASAYDELRAQLLERDALLREAITVFRTNELLITAEYFEKLSTSAEPRAPRAFIACQVDEICGQDG